MEGLVEILLFDFLDNFLYLAATSGSLHCNRKSHAGTGFVVLLICSFSLLSMRLSFHSSLMCASYCAIPYKVKFLQNIPIRFSPFSSLEVGKKTEKRNEKEGSIFESILFLNFSVFRVIHGKCHQSMKRVMYLSARAVESLCFFSSLKKTTHA